MFDAIKFVYNEHKNNINRIWHIAISHMRKQTIRTSLGIWWTVIRDLIYFSAFTMFRYLLSGGNEVEGMHFIVYLITGLIPWFFINEVINGGSSAIKANKNIVINLTFPITILPTIEVTAIFLKRIFNLIFMFIIVYIFEGFSNINIILFIYYFILMYIMMVIYNWIFSGFIAISQDFHQLYLAIARILLFFLPIFWSYEYIRNNVVILTLLKAIPFTYIIEGFRNSIVHNSLPSLNYSLYMFCFLIVMFLIGVTVQFRLRKYYSDFM